MLAVPRLDPSCAGLGVPRAGVSVLKQPSLVAGYSCAPPTLGACVKSLFLDVRGSELGLPTSPRAGEVQRLVWVGDTCTAALTWEEVPSLVPVGALRVTLACGTTLLALVLLCTV